MPFRKVIPTYGTTFPILSNTTVAKAHDAAESKATIIPTYIIINHQNAYPTPIVKSGISFHI